MKKSMIMLSIKFSVIAFIIVVVLRFVLDKVLRPEQYVNVKQLASYSIAIGLSFSLFYMFFIGLAHREYKHKFGQLAYKDALSIGLICIGVISLLGLLLSEMWNLIYFIKDSRSPLRPIWFTYFIWPIIDVLILFIILLPMEGLWLLYKKANQPGWACLIPVYDLIVMLKIAKYKWTSIFIFLIPVVNVGFSYILLNDVVKRFGKKFGFTLGLIFLPIIFYPIIGFGKAEYDCNLDTW